MPLFVWVNLIVDILTDYGVYLLPALGVYIILTSGQVSFGHAAFLGIAAYSSAILVVKWGLSYYLAIPLCGLVGAVTGLLVGTLLGLKLRGIYLGIATFALSEALVTLWLNIDYIGGAGGFGTIPMETEWPQVLVVAALAIFFVYRLDRSRFGLAFRTVRDNEAAAATRGVDVRHMKVLAWVLGCGLTGIGGALYAHRAGTISPVEFGFYNSIDIVLAPILGGVQSFWGPVAGAGILYSLQWILQFAGVPPEYRLMVEGLLVVAMMIFRPQGIVARTKDPIIPKYGIGGAQ